MREKKTFVFETGRNHVRTDLTGTVVLSLLYSLGMLFSLFQLVPFPMGTRVLVCELCCGPVLAGGVFGFFLKGYRKWSLAFPAVGAVLELLYFGPARIALGWQAYCNVLITRWNLRWKDGIPLLGDGQMTEDALAAFACFALLLLIVLFWYLAAKRACIRVLCLLMLCLVPEIVLCYSSSAGSMLLLTCAVGTWLLFFQGGSRMRRLQWLFGLGCVFALISATSGIRQVSGLLQLQQNAAKAVDRIRYGESSLPDGDLALARQMQAGEADTLLVTTEQIKPLYFRGFVGADYDSGAWKPLSKSAYGKERWGFLDWMNVNAFDVNAQYAAYQSVGQDTQTEAAPENHITVNNQGTDRKYIYDVYSASAPAGQRIVPWRDDGYRSRALFGSRDYTYTEKSADIPGELLQLAEWAYAPKTPEQDRYLQGEMVYRDFVYENYLNIPQSLEPEIHQLFHTGQNGDFGENAFSEKSVYELTQDIRNVMEKQFYYQQLPETVDAEDPLDAFLLGQSYGNSAYYASAGVLALRSFGIPARYAEGYFLSREAIEQTGNGRVQLTEKDAHAWTEIYMDGIGWIPVDFTPGFYYNTYALLRMAELPQNIRKTAALDDNGDEAETVTGNMPQNGRPEEEKPHGPEIPENLIWGIVLTFLFVAELLFAVLEITRWRYERRVHKPLCGDAGAEAAFLVPAIAQNLRVCGIDVRPGWKKEETEEQIRACFPEIPAGFYQRVNDTLEKYVYGGVELAPQELRILHRFFITLRDSKNKLDFRRRMALRYIAFFSAGAAEWD